MHSLFRVIAITLAGALLAACMATTSALEPQNKALSGDKARIYILRPNAWALRVQPAHLKIDDQDIGAVANNSFLFVDRPPGRHKLNVSVPFDLGTNELDVQMTAGRSYYFVINMKSSTMMAGGIVLTIPEQRTGKPVGQRSLFAMAYLAELDATAGAALVARMKTDQP